MIRIEPFCQWTAENTHMLRPAIEVDPLADCADELRAVGDGKATLFNVYRGDRLAGCFTGALAISENGDEFIVRAAGAPPGQKPVTLECVSEFDRLAREGLASAVRMTIYNPRLVPILRRKGYRPIAVTLKKGL